MPKYEAWEINQIQYFINTPKDAQGKLGFKFLTVESTWSVIEGILRAMSLIACSIVILKYDNLDKKYYRILKI